LRLAKSLGANEQKFLGTRSNVNFLGKGPSEGGLFQSSINTEALRAVPLEKALPEIETAMAYATGGKLNDIQVNKLIDNMSRMEDFYHPKAVANITDMASGTGDLTRGGLESLRTADEAVKRFPEESHQFMGRPLKDVDFAKIDRLVSEGKIPSAGESPLMSRISERVKNIKNETDEASAIMETVPKNDVAGKTASSREFLLNALKEGDEVGRVTFRDTVTPQDLKYITEGGGGVDGDPIVLVQKYFGPRVAELIPATSSVEDMAIFTKRVLETATDAKGLRPSDPGFDKLTLKIQESVKETPEGFPFAQGGRAGFAGGQRVRATGDGTRPGYRGEDWGQEAAAMSQGSANVADSNPYSDAAQAANRELNNRISNGGNTIVANTSGGGDGGGTGITQKNPGFVDWITSPIDSLQKYAGVYNYDQENEDEKEDDETIYTSDPTGSQNLGILHPNAEIGARILSNQEKKNKRLSELMKMAEGGRAGYRVGGIAKAILKKINKKTVKKAVDDIFETGDYKYDAELAAEALVENNPKLFGGKLIDDIDEGLRSEIYGLTLAELSSRMALKMQARRAGKIPFTETVTEAVRPQFQLSVEKAVNELNIPRAEAMRIARLTSSEQKLALQKYMDTDLRQRSELMNYTPKKFDAAHGGLAKILEV